MKVSIDYKKVGQQIKDIYTDITKISTPEKTETEKEDDNRQNEKIEIKK